MPMSRPRRGAGRAKEAAATLSRAEIVRVGLEILDREGVSALSTRRLAAALGVTPMALYNHVRDKTDLSRAIAASVIDAIVYPAPKGHWRAQLAGCFRAIRAACLAHPGTVRLIESADDLPESVFLPMERTLLTLTAAGASQQDATRAFYLLITFTLGQVGYQTRGWGKGVDPATAFERGRIASGPLPRLVRSGAGSEWDWDASFEFGLKCILAGIAAALPSRSRK
jgi:TetR/AcrR family transcriptional regulator, tetracycline repressor protein